ncbi:MAG TPA: protein phosphatase 2C domain-containing protein [Anaerolineae bacterium]|nr:protein phosphatase 2C domain-containing protein [Anaerolineae bacterium]
MSEQQIPCPNCGALNRANAKFCNNCRTPLPVEIATKPLALDPQTSGQPTTRLDAPATIPDNDFAELPEGAIVNDRYEILPRTHATPLLNAYIVNDEQSGRQWILYESGIPDYFARAQEVITSGASHPALTQVGQVFNELQYGETPRSYMTVEFPIAPLPEQLQLNEIDLLKWGAELGGALEALHTAKLAHNDIRRESVVTNGEQPKLTNLAHVTPLTEEARQKDIAQLAATLNALIRPPGKTAVLLSPEVNQILQRALGPNMPDGYRTAGEFAATFQDALERKRRPSSINLRVGRMTDVGIKRELNEDAFLTAEYVRAMQKGGGALGLYVVSDGMGGTAAGELASQIVTETIAREFSANILLLFADGDSPRDYGALLKMMGEKANRAVYDERQKLHNDMGATLVAALIVGAQAHIINVGDSRAYLIRDNKMERISKDHSLVESLRDAGQITEADVRTHPQRNIITRSIGDKPTVQFDLFPQPLQVGDSLLLCCDGMWEMAQDEEICQKIVQTPDPQTAVRELVGLANKNGGDDNITCILVRIEDASAASK